MIRKAVSGLAFTGVMAAVSIGAGAQDNTGLTDARRVELNDAQRARAGVLVGELIAESGRSGQRGDTQSNEPPVRSRERVDQILALLAAAQGRTGGPAPEAVQGRGGRRVAINPTATVDPLGGPVVRDAPYSADAVTTVSQTLGDGTRIGHNVTARFARDSAGRVRREQAIIGLSPEPQSTVTVDPDPGDGSAYLLDANTRTARRVPAGGGLVVSDRVYYRLTSDPNGGRTVRLNGEPVAVTTGQAYFFQGWPGPVSWVSPPPQLPAGVRPVEESLGTRVIEGVKATGRKATTTIPTGLVGNDRPIVITDERWESPELRVLVLSRFHDPRTGDVEYQLTNINRSEPASDLFVVPSGYEILGGERSGGAGGRGQRTGGPGRRGGNSHTGVHLCCDRRGRSLDRPRRV